MSLPSSSSHHATRSWGQAYLAFLLSKDESFVLKIAPLLLLFGGPEMIASNLIPVIGEVADISGFSLFLLVTFRTLQVVRKYR